MDPSAVQYSPCETSDIYIYHTRPDRGVLWFLLFLFLILLIRVVLNEESEEEKESEYHDKHIEILREVIREERAREAKEDYTGFFIEEKEQRDFPVALLAN